MARALEIAGSLLRVALAAGLLWLCWQNQSAVLARAGFAALPDFDYWKHGEQLLDQERFSEALLVVDAGLAAVPEQQVHLAALRARIELERNNWMTRFQQIGRGALHGVGESPEALGGAIVADLFVFGDVRDLVIQAGRRLRGDEADPVLVALSAGGILLTVNPGLDFGAALLKFARRMGAMTEAFARQLVATLEAAVRKQNADEVLRITGDMGELARHARPAGAVTILRHVDDAADLRRAVEFARRPGGAFALWLGGKPALAWLKTGGRHGGELLLQATRKGRAGLDYLAEHAPLMLRPHPLLGLVKGFYKGNIPAALAELFRAWADLLLGVAGGWLLYEVCLLSAALLRSRPAPLAG